MRQRGVHAWAAATAGGGCLYTHQLPLTPRLVACRPSRGQQGSAAGASSDQDPGPYRAASGSASGGLVVQGGSVASKALQHRRSAGQQGWEADDMLGASSKSAHSMGELAVPGSWSIPASVVGKKGN